MNSKPNSANREERGWQENKTNIFYWAGSGLDKGIYISDNITKKCLPDGTWDNYTNYKSCLDHPCCHCGGEVADWQIFIWILGYSVSIISLLFAIFIFMYFRWKLYWTFQCLKLQINNPNRVWKILFIRRDLQLCQDKCLGEVLTTKQNWSGCTTGEVWGNSVNFILLRGLDHDHHLNEFPLDNFSLI